MCVSCGHKGCRKAALSQSQHSLSSPKKVYLHSWKNFTQKWNPLRIPPRFSAFTKNVIYLKTAQGKVDSLGGWAQSLVVEVAGGWQQLWAWWIAEPEQDARGMRTNRWHISFPLPSWGTSILGNGNVYFPQTKSLRNNYKCSNFIRIHTVSFARCLNRTQVSCLMQCYCIAVAGASSLAECKWKAARS